MAADWDGRRLGRRLVDSDTRLGSRLVRRALCLPSGAPPAIRVRDDRGAVTGDERGAVTGNEPDSVSGDKSGVVTGDGHGRDGQGCCD